MSPSELKQFAGTCAALGDKAANEDGFVELRRLVALMKAEVEFRPLLVEAVIAAPVGQGTWKVLVDSETYPDGPIRYQSETQAEPLQPRLRNTIAHELLHTLSFRSEEFGVRLNSEKNESRAEAVKRLERETESFSPFLLLSQKVIESEIESRGLSLETLLNWQKRWAVSREVLVARCALFQSLPEFRLRHERCINNVAVCVGEWANNGSATLREWPLFLSFQSGIVPEFILQLRQNGRPSLADLFPDPGFILNGGSSRSTQNMLPGGTVTNPRSTELTVLAEVEDTPSKKREPFLAVFRVE